MTGPLGHRPFRALLAGRSISMLGTAIAPVAIAFAVLDLTGSAAALGLVLAARSIPEVVFLLVGGVIADRFDRARILVVATSSRASRRQAPPRCCSPELPPCRPSLPLRPQTARRAPWCFRPQPLSRR
jgi:hypothetical protein